MHTDYTAHRFVHDFACASLDVDAILPVLRTCFEVLMAACPPQLSTGARFQSEELKLPNEVGWESDPVTRAIEPIRTLLTPWRAAGCPGFRGGIDGAIRWARICADHVWLKEPANVSMMEAADAAYAAHLDRQPTNADGKCASFGE